MAASDRKNSEKKMASIDMLPVDLKNHILTFVGKIGIKDFKYSRQTIKEKKAEEKENFPSFYANLMVLLSYMERAELAKLIATNLLRYYEIEKTLQLVRDHQECLFIPILTQDFCCQLIEGTPLQIVYAMGDRNPPNMKKDAKTSGLAEQLRLCFKNPDQADKQIAEWQKDSKKATEETMAPYYEAIKTACQAIIECKEMPEDDPDIYDQIEEEFATALTSNPKHIVRSGFLFSIEIFLRFIEIFIEYADNEHVEDKSRPNLGGRQSEKSNAFISMVYPKLQSRSLYNLSMFQTGIWKVVDGQIPKRMSINLNEPPEILQGIGGTHFFGSGGKKLELDDLMHGGQEPWSLWMELLAGFFQDLLKAQTKPLSITQPSQISPPIFSKELDQLISLGYRRRGRNLI